jgi:hypothetical protein
MRMKLPRQAVSVLPLLLLLIVLGTGAVLTVMLDSSPVASPPSIRTAADINALRASSLWKISYVFLIVALAWNGFVATGIAVAHLKTTGLWLTGIASGLGMLAGRAMSIQSNTRPGSPMTIVDRATRLPIHSTSVVSTTLALGVVTLVVAASVALGRRSGGVMTETELRSRVGEARVFLFSAAALLASALIAVYLTMVWPVDLPAVPGATMPDGVLKDLAVTVTMNSGIFYSVCLVVLFVPVAIIHEQWIEESWNAAKSLAPNQSRADWLKENALDRSIVDTAAQIIAIAAPWLAAVGLPRLKSGG